MLTQLRIINFKSLADTKNLDIRPLTFLVGPNSSGKSSLLQVLLALRQTVDSLDTTNPFAANDGWVKLGGYSDFIYRHQTRRKFEIHLQITLAPSILTVFSWLEPLDALWGAKKEGRRRRRSKISNPAGSRLDLKFVFRYNRQTTQIELERGELSVSPLNKDGAEMAQLVYYIQQPTDSQQRYRAELKWSYQGKEQSEQLQDITLLKFYGIGLWKLESTWEPPEIGFLLYFQTISDSLETVFRRLFYIGPLRKAPERIYFTSGQTPQDVGMSGERVAEVLWIAHRTRGRERRLLDEIQQWLGKFGIASQLELEPLGETNYRVMLIDPSTRIEVNLADVGFGASQVLPVIVECLYAPEGSLLLMEQPEIHLHPKAQATLGDLFIEAVRRGDRQLIVETHSEHVLSRVRRRMAEGKIAPDEVAIYYFQPTSKGTRVQEIKLNEYGQYEEFPEGFFEEDLIEAFEHMDAIRKRTLKEKRSSGRQRMDD